MSGRPNATFIKLHAEQLKSEMKRLSRLQNRSFWAFALYGAIALAVILGFCAYFSDPLPQGYLLKLAGAVASIYAVGAALAERLYRNDLLTHGSTVFACFYDRDNLLFVILSDANIYEGRGSELLVPNQQIESVTYEKNDSMLVIVRKLWSPGSSSTITTGGLFTTDRIPLPQDMDGESLVQTLQSRP